MLPILYSFRRCPYAMRARLALAMSRCSVELREVSLKRKPTEMLMVSPKGTVPVLDFRTPAGPVADDQSVLEESLDIMRWAFCVNSLDDKCLGALESLDAPLLVENDNQFKYWLDRYKYADRYPEISIDMARQKASCHIMAIEAHLRKETYLSGEAFGLLDAAIAPFVRQFSGVEPNWFISQPWPSVIHWLEQFKSSNLFRSVMTKHPEWSREAREPVIEHWEGE